MYVYKITNNVNNKSYIGITKDYVTRWRLHRQTCFNEAHPEYQKVLYRAFRKYGLESFTFSVLYSNLNVEEAKLLEIQLIKDLNCLVSSGLGYNVSPGGDIPNGKILKGEEHPGALLTENEAKDIIAKRESQNYRKSYVFDLYKHKIGAGGFDPIWHGRSWKHLQPETITLINGNRGTTRDQAIAIIERRENGELQKDVYNDYKNSITKTSFQYVWLGYIWKELQPEKITNRRGKLSDTQVIEIRNSKETYRKIAKTFNISSATVSDIKNFKAYKDVT